MMDGLLVDLGERTQLELTGSQRAKFLHGFCTNDIVGLAPSRGCEAFVCNIQGKVLGHIAVFCGETSLWIDSVPGQEDALFAHLDRYLINEDVQIHRRTEERGELYLHGAPAPGVLEKVGWTVAATLVNAPVLSHGTVRDGDADVQLRTVDWLGEAGWLISAPKTVLPKLIDQLQAAGATAGDKDLWNALRIEAGFPWYGIDMTSDNLAQEVARTERCISFRKGCYLGQEPIARIDALGHVNRELRRLRIDADEVPTIGSPIVESNSETPIGSVTSAAISGTTPGRIAALGYVRTKYGSAGTKVAVSTASGRLAAEVQQHGRPGH